MLAACRAGCAVPLRWEVPRRVCPEVQEGHAGCLLRWLCCAIASGGSLKVVASGAGRSCWLPVELVVLCLCVGRFPKGRVPRRRKVMLAACRAGRTVPLRWEVPRRACPEAQEGRAGCLSSWSCCAFASGGSPKGVSRGAGRSCWLRV